MQRRTQESEINMLWNICDWQASPLRDLPLLSVGCPTLLSCWQVFSWLAYFALGLSLKFLFLFNWHTALGAYYYCKQESSG